MSITPAVAREVYDLVKDRGFRVIIVGSMAVSLAGGRTPSDVDLLASVSGFGGIPTYLQLDKRVGAFASPGDTHLLSAVFKMTEGDVRVDLLDPGVFTGKADGDAFFEHVDRERTTEAAAGRVAAPEVVWYMRLVISGDDQLRKIVADIQNGAPQDWFAGARRIAEEFWMTDRIEAGLRRLAELRATDSG